jgi:hypothetical protein
MTPEQISKLINKKIFYNNLTYFAGGLFGILIVEWKHYKPVFKKQ